MQAPSSPFPPPAGGPPGGAPGGSPFGPPGGAPAGGMPPGAAGAAGKGAASRLPPTFYPYFPSFSPAVFSAIFYLVFMFIHLVWPFTRKAKIMALPGKALMLFALAAIARAHLAIVPNHMIAYIGSSKIGNIAPLLLFGGLVMVGTRCVWAIVPGSHLRTDKTLTWYIPRGMISIFWFGIVMIPDGVKTGISAISQMTAKQQSKPDPKSPMSRMEGIVDVWMIVAVWAWMLWLYMFLNKTAKVDRLSGDRMQVAKARTMAYVLLIEVGLISVSNMVL